MKFAALSFGIGTSGVAAFPGPSAKIHAKIGNAVKDLGNLEMNLDLLKKKTSGCPPSFPFKIAPNFPNSQYDLCYNDIVSAKGGSGPCGSWCATAGDWPRVEILWGDTCGSLCPSTDAGVDMKQEKESRALPYKKFDDTICKFHRVVMFRSGDLKAQCEAKCDSSKREGGCPGFSVSETNRYCYICANVQHYEGTDYKVNYGPETGQKHWNNYCDGGHWCTTQYHGMSQLYWKVPREGSRLSIATSQTKCDASNCGNWDCDAWCKCFNEADEKDGIYTSNDCDDDGDEECKCLVDYGEEKSARSCGKNLFKPTEGRPALDGTGCEMCTEFNSKKLGKNNSPKCDLEFNTITKCTATQDAVCTPKPKKVCYEMQHYQWRMKDNLNHCETYNFGREWTFKGHFAVNGEAYHTQCKHVYSSFYNTGYHESYHGSNIAVGEYTPGMKVTMGYESWENDTGDVCNYDADYHKGYINMGWLGTINRGWTNHGDDCHQHKNQEFTVPTSPGNSNTWQETTLNSLYTSMKVRTRTWEAYSCV